MRAALHPSDALPLLLEHIIMDDNASRRTIAAQQLKTIERERQVLRELVAQGLTLRQIVAVLERWLSHTPPCACRAAVRQQIGCQPDGAVG